MNEKWEIILSGVGGQGLVVGGTMLGEAATLFDGKYAVLTTSYGTETRGTFTKSEIIICQEQAAFPEVEHPDVVLALAQVAYDRYVSAIGEDAILVYDSSMVTDIKPSKARQVGAPYTELSREMGRVGIANIMALGTIIGLTGAVRPESYKNALARRFAGKDRVIELNVHAFEKGLALAKEAK